MEARVRGPLARRGGQRGRQARKASGGRGFGRDRRRRTRGGQKQGGVRGGRAVPRGDGGAGRRRRRRRRRRVGGGASRPEPNADSGISADHDDVRGEARDVRGGRRHRARKSVLSREARAESRRGAASGGVAPGGRWVVWVLQYYRGVASWTWYYPFHYAPALASDLADSRGELTLFDFGVPFRPFEQLLAVQPPQSSALLPEPFRWHDRAALAAGEFFPDELKVDFEGK